MTQFNSVPGIRSIGSIVPRQISRGFNLAQYRTAPTFYWIDGNTSRDVGNVPTSLLRAGLFLGKETSGTYSGKYCNSIIGLTNANIAAAATSITVNAAVATEVARLIALAAASVPLTITGPPATGGTVASTAVLASAASGTTLTVGTTNTNEVQTLAVDATMTAGSIAFGGVINTGVPFEVKVAFNTSWTGTVADIQTALNAEYGSSAVACAVTNTHDMTVTFSGTGYTGVTQTLLTVDISGATSVTKATITRTTTGAGALPAVVVGSLIQPGNGAQTILTILDIEDGVPVVQQDGTNTDQTLARYLTGTDLATANLINYSGANEFGTTVEPSCTTFIRTALKAVGVYTFDTDR